MIDTSTNTKRDVTQKNHWYSGFGNYVGYLMAGVATLTSAIADIERHFHKDFFDEMEKFKFLKNDKIEKYETAINDIGSDLPKLIRQISQIDKEAHEAEKKAARDFLKVTSVYQKWNLIKPHQRLEVGLKMATVLSLAVGAIFTIKRNNQLSAKVQFQENNKNEAMEAKALEKARAELEKEMAPRRFAAVDQMAADAKALQEGTPSNFSAMDDLGARVDQHAREREPALARAH